MPLRTPNLTVANDPCQMTLQGHSREVYGVALQDVVIVSGSYLDGEIKIWSVETGECLCTFNNDDHAINGVAIENNHIVAGDSKGVVHAFQLNTR